MSLKKMSFHPLLPIKKEEINARVDWSSRLLLTDRHVDDEENGKAALAEHCAPRRRRRRLLLLLRPSSRCRHPATGAPPPPGPLCLPRSRSRSSSTLSALSLGSLSYLLNPIFRGADLYFRFSSAATCL